MAKIMVVDDEESTRQLLSDVLSNEGYEVVLANDGNDCMGKISKEKPDLIVLDIMMPDMNGWDVAAKVKRSEDSKEIPIIFLTAKTDQISKELGKLTSEHYIEKPFQMDDFLKRVKDTLDKK